MLWFGETDMMAVRGVTLLGWLAVLCSAVLAQQAPEFCRSLECPNFKVVKQYGDFEHRIYEETHWVVTSLKFDFFNIGTVKSFRRLFKYISGHNSQELKINMTVPVLTLVPVTQPPAPDATMSFFLSPTLQNPPTPSDPEVYLETKPSRSVYVKTFGGYAMDGTYNQKAKALAEELRALGIQFEDSYYLRAGYNDPFTFTNRHNEVWYLGK